MSIVKMKRLRVVGMGAERDELLKALQRAGCVEVDVPTDKGDSPEWAALTRVDDTGLGDTKARIGELKAALATLNLYEKDKGGMLSARPTVTEETLFDEGVKAAALTAAAAIGEQEKNIAAIHSEESKLKSQKLSLAPWVELDAPLETGSTREVAVLFGGVSVRSDMDEVARELAAATDLCQMIPAGKDREMQYLLLLCHKDAEEPALEVLKRHGFTRSTLRGWTGTARENMAALDKRLGELPGEIAAAKEAIVAQTPHRDAIKRAIDRMTQDAQREEVKGRLMESRATVFFEGWVPEAEEQHLRDTLAAFTCAWDTRQPVEEEFPRVPVKLKNNIFTRSLNVVTDMYALPAYNGIDPNPLMAPFFILFFGVMMADMGYGLLMIGAALFVLLKTKPKEGTRNFMELVFLCGVSTFILGALTGGFFGDFIPQLVGIINPESTFEMPSLFTPLGHTVPIMIGSMALGLIQIITGMAVSVVKKIKDGDVAGAIWGEITWWVILAGIALAVLGIGSVGGVPVVLAVGGLMLLYGSTYKAKGLGKVAALIGAVYTGVTGLFSDTLSYVRLMALMLAGSVIAQVFNTLGAVFGNVIIFVLISIVGNALNLALSLLGCYVHNLRLQCLEFFGRFYQEGGRRYNPLRMQTKYVDIIEEEQ